MRKLKINKEIWEWKAGEQFVLIQNKEKGIKYLPTKESLFKSVVPSKCGCVFCYARYPITPKIVRDFIDQMKKGSFSPIAIAYEKCSLEMEDYL